MVLLSVQLSVVVTLKLVFLREKKTKKNQNQTYLQNFIAVSL